jgi:hypothetical protein
LPDTFVFDDFRLESAEYFFYEITEEASKKIIEELNDKYGDPELSKDDVTAWLTDNTRIVYTSSDGYSYLNYSTIFVDLDKFIEKSKSKETKGDL